MVPHGAKECVYAALLKGIFGPETRIEHAALEYDFEDPDGPGAPASPSPDKDAEIEQEVDEDWVGALEDELFPNISDEDNEDPGSRSSSPSPPPPPASPPPPPAPAPESPAAPMEAAAIGHLIKIRGHISSAPSGTNLGKLLFHPNSSRSEVQAWLVASDVRLAQVGTFKLCSLW